MSCFEEEFRNMKNKNENKFIKFYRKIDKYLKYSH